MPHDVHLRPDHLREHAATAVELADTLRAALALRPADAALDPLDASVRRGAGELAELAAALAAAAAGAESADRAAAAAVNRAGRT